MWRPATAAPAAAAAATSPGTAWWTTSGTSTSFTHTHRESECVLLILAILSWLDAFMRIIISNLTFEIVDDNHNMLISTI